MNSRERMLAVLNRQTPDRVPTDIWATGEVWEKLKAHFGENADLRTLLHLDGMAGVGPRYVGPKLPGDRHVDYWGIEFRKIDYGCGEYDEIARHPLADAGTIDDLEAYDWPEVDWFDYSRIADDARRVGQEQVVQSGYMAPFTYHIYLRGLENALMDPLVNPQFTHHLLGRMTVFLADHHRRIFQAADGTVDLTQVTDDYGMQTGPMISLDTFRRFYRPHLERFASLAREFRVKVFHHDDGAIRQFIPDLIDIGIDVLNPVQWRCPGMEMEELKRDFGGQLIFHGGIDNQQTLPFANEFEVRAEVRRAIDTLAADRTGYILAPCHNIQANTPVENILAMYDEAHHYGRFD